jgi:hypothetical protein
MPRLIITLDLPEGTTVSFESQGGVDVSSESGRDPVEEYWTDYLKPNGRRLYWAAASIEGALDGSFSLEDIARHLKLDYDSVKSYHRNSGRTAAKWEREKGKPPPVQLVFDGNYGPQEGAAGWRSRYRLPAGVADKVLAQEAP